LSKSPKDFARINFGFGKPYTEPIVKVGEEAFLVANIENLGAGKVTKVNQYLLDMKNKDITPTQTDCLSGTGASILLSDITQTTIPLSSCFVKIEQTVIESGKEFELKEYTAKLVYSYQLEEKIPNIQVKLR
jgi:hypothetical protein